MKKLSLVLAFVGLISAASFASSTHPTKGGAKKQGTEKAQTPKKHKTAKKAEAKKEDAKPKATSTAPKSK